MFKVISEHIIVQNLVTCDQDENKEKLTYYYIKSLKFHHNINLVYILYHKRITWLVTMINLMKNVKPLSILESSRGTCLRHALMKLLSLV